MTVRRSADRSANPSIKRSIKIAGIIGLSVVATGILAVNLLPVVTNDSLTYIDQSRDILSGGVVEGGYRQVGYPAMLWFERFVSGILGAEPLLMTALLQRLLLVGAVTYSVILWRWKAIPVMLLVLTPGLVVYPNYVLTEGVTVPLSLILACLVYHYFMLDAGKTAFSRSERREISQIVLFGVLSVVVAALIVVRFPLAVFGLIPLAIAGHAVVNRSPVTGKIVAIAAGFALLGTVFTLAAAIENSREFDMFSPTTNGAGAEYWGAWRLTFGLNPENQDNPQLASYFDGGSPHPFLARMTDAYPRYQDRAEAIEQSIVDLLALSGTNRNRERMFSIMGALRGGRHNDLAAYAKTVLASDARSIDEAINRNSYAIANGPQAFADQYNDGLLPQAVVTSPIFPLYPSPGIQAVLAYLLPITWIGLIVLALKKRRYTIGLIFLIPPLTMALAMGWLLLDNTRLLISTSVFAIAGLSGLLSAQSTPRSGP